MKKLLLALLFLIPLFAHANSTCDGMWSEHARFPLTNAHAQGKCTCASCHIGSFQTGSAGGGSTCMSCHGSSARPSARPKDSGHIQTTQDCVMCHNTTNFDNARMNHTGITTGCTQCHTKPSSHPSVTNPACEACHNTTPTGWKCISG